MPWLWFDRGAWHHLEDVFGRKLGQELPRLVNGELRIAGFDALSPQQDSALRLLVAVDADLVDLSHASRPVLETLPGFSSAVVDAVLAARGMDASTRDLLHLIAALPEPARDSVVANYDRLLMRTTTAPTHWLLVSDGRSGVPVIQVHVELLLAAGGGRVGIIRRRYWME